MKVITVPISWLIKPWINKGGAEVPHTVSIKQATESVNKLTDKLAQRKEVAENNVCKFYTTWETKELTKFCAPNDGLNSWESIDLYLFCLLAKNKTDGKEHYILVHKLRNEIVRESYSYMNLYNYIIAMKIHEEEDRKTLSLLANQEQRY